MAGVWSLTLSSWFMLGLTAHVSFAYGQPRLLIFGALAVALIHALMTSVLAEDNAGIDPESEEWVVWRNNESVSIVLMMVTTSLSAAAIVVGALNDASQASASILQG